MAEEGLYLERLFDPLEEKLRLPPVTLQLCDGGGKAWTVWGGFYDELCVATQNGASSEVWFGFIADLIFDVGRKSDSYHFTSSYLTSGGSKWKNMVIDFVYSF